MTLPKFTLEGKVAVVTGGSRGIGRAIAVAYAESGADVVVASRTAAELEAVAMEIRALGRRSLAVPTDITVKSAVDTLAQRTKEEFGRVDILVNNAAMNIMRPLLDLREDGWDRIIDTDLKGSWLCCQAFGKMMIQAGGGCIINLASGGARKPAQAMGAYNIAKVGIVMLTRVLALELAAQNIRVNAIGPGMVRTKFSEPIWANPEVLQKIAPGIPMGRIGETDDIVGAALFLASDASRYVTGQTIYVDGGITA